LNEDFRRFLVVGAHAVALYGVPRATGDLDVWFPPEASNAERVWKALALFGAPLSALGFEQQDLAAVDQVVQIGVPPRRIDLLTGISGVTFDEAWPERVVASVSGLDVPFIGRQALLRNQRASGRAKDLADIEALGG
jgi:hypothetical protein